MERKLIALDLDGTTLNAESKLNSATIQTMQRLQAAGHIVSIITGRSYQGSQAIYDQLRLKSLMINFNGSLAICLTKHGPQNISSRSTKRLS